MNYFISEEKCLDDLKAFLKIPSVSTNDKYNNNVLECATFLVERLHKIGFTNIKQFNEAKHPIIYAEKLINEKLPTLLIYGHYDVQPADPIELWDTPPFEPTIKNGKIYARGASDDKSQVHLIMVALDRLFSNQTPSCNIKIIFEGEEEIGSTGLYSFVEKNKELLKANTLLVCDTAMPDINKPALINGLRGIAYFNLEVFGAPFDTHSGMLGGGIINPLNELCRVLGKIKDADNNLTIPDLIAESTVISSDENEVKIIDELEAYKTEGNFYKQTTAKTSFDIHGIWGGYTEPGAKTVITAKANAKCSFRLAEGHSHEYISKLFNDFLKNYFHPSINFKLEKLATCNAVNIPINSTEMKLAAKCLNKHFGNNPIINRIGGTIPVVALFKEKLNLTPLLMGFGLDSDRIHSPNESFSIYNYFKGIDVLVDFISEYGSAINKHENIETEALAG